MSRATDWLADSRALCDRAQRHYDEFKHLVGRNAEHSLWQIEQFPDEGADTYTYALKLNRDVLTRIKPVAADIANNLVHSLDQLVGAAARLRGHDRKYKPSFPWALNDAVFMRELKSLSKIIGAEITDKIEQVRESHHLWLPQIHAVKTLSNSGKHWELIPSNTSPVAVAVSLPNQRQTIWQVPADALHEIDLYKFAVGVPRIVNVPFNIVIKFVFEGLGEGVTATPETIFNCTFRYVRDMIAANEAHWAS